ncbi:hypothetical protein CEXT_576301 [Caerostris extrusa]|uniref:Uncharacterized protein n=1 Tax=Caerostris extrusa TaxID=172846 RepID=A0AAV4QJV0_CAEEX|nr:hypothetical protein CEXT_576301 [Caerostris extrusa]
MIRALLCRQHKFQKQHYLLKMEWFFYPQFQLLTFRYVIILTINVSIHPKVPFVSTQASSHRSAVHQYECTFPLRNRNAVL